MRGELKLSNQEDWICRTHCRYYKPNSTEEDRCRGYSLASVLFSKSSDSPSLAAEDSFDQEFERSFLREQVCEACPFLVDGCDFTSLHPPRDCLPCGGLVLISGLLKQETLSEEAIRGANLIDRNWENALCLTPRCATKSLEEYYLYHVSHDELYEVNSEAFDMLLRCDGQHTVAELEPEPAFLAFAVAEDLLQFSSGSSPMQRYMDCSPVPSLRYLEWLVTYRCNLSCAHCYLGEASNTDFPAALLRPLLEQFSHMQGLRILVSGGEPTLYPHFQRLNDMLRDFPIRAVLLSNGLTLDDKASSSLRFHEVQISLDGLEQGHDMIRGKGSFEKAMRAMHAVLNAGLDLSVATMVHRGNLNEFKGLSELISKLEVREWSIDYPCFAGRWASNPDLAVSFEDAAKSMSFGFGGSYHGTSPGWTCGRHLAAVLPSGEIVRCGLYPQKCYGHMADGLAEAWAKVEHIPIDLTLCGKCEYADTCGGGCRFRVGNSTSRDEVMCRLYGVEGDTDFPARGDDGDAG